MLNQLEEIQDWTGTTIIESDIVGNIKSVIDDKGRRISYEWGSCGERTRIIYPDGSDIRYKYDKFLRLKTLQYENKKISYEYGTTGRLEKKELANGLNTTYCYDQAGNLVELAHSDYRGALDKYSYQYDMMGNKIEINKYRSGLQGESGRYTYEYDSLNRLTGVKRNGEFLRKYQYDDYGNRIFKEEGNDKISYDYNALNQMVREEKTDCNVEYRYDLRGNLNSIIENGTEICKYEYNAMNSLGTAINKHGVKAVYLYNGLGMRVGKVEDGLNENIDYLLDFTKPYHNLLQKTTNNKSQRYIWDSNAAMLDTDGRQLYYMQDEMGSPIRLGMENGRTEAIYDYDEFGIEKNSTIGMSQPFGFTGYQADRNSGTYFAQAREYKPEIGRFISQDVIRGSISSPKSLNRYSYCLNSPLNLVDLNGKQSSPWDYWTNDPYTQFANDMTSYANDKIQETYDSVVEEGKRGIEAAANSAREGWDSFTDACEKAKGGWNDAVDQGEDMIRNSLEESMGTTNVSVGGRASAGLSGSGSFGLTIDKGGNVAPQVTINVGGGMYTTGWSVSFTQTNASSYLDLEKRGALVGGSVGAGKMIGVDYVIALPDRETNGPGFQGISWSLGKGVGLEGHGEAGYTWTIPILGFNIYNALDCLKFDIEECNS